MVENGVRTLAFQAVGLPAPVGRMVSGLGMLGLGNPIMVGILAGITAAGFAIKALTRDAEDNAKATKKMNDELEKLGAHGEIQSLRNQIADLEAKRDQPSFGKFWTGTWGVLMEGPLQGAQNAQVARREEINRQIAERENRMRRLQGDLPGVDEGEKAARSADLSRRQAEVRLRGALAGDSELVVARRVRALALEYEHIDPKIRKVILEREQETAQLDMQASAYRAVNSVQAEAQIRAEMLGASEEAVTEAIRKQTLVMLGWNPAAAAALAANERFAGSLITTSQVLRRQLPAAFAALGTAATQSMQAVVASALQSISQIAQALPGITPVQSGIIGLVSGLLSSLFGNRSRPMPVEVTNPEDLRPEGPDRFTLQILSAGTGELLDEVVYELGRRTRLDRVVRIPRGVVLARG